LYCFLITRYVIFVLIYILSTVNGGIQLDPKEPIFGDPPVFVNPDSDAGDLIDVYENEEAGVNIYTLSVNDLFFFDTHTFRYKFIS